MSQKSVDGAAQGGAPCTAGTPADGSPAAPRLTPAVAAVAEKATTEADSVAFNSAATKQQG